MTKYRGPFPILCFRAGLRDAILTVAVSAVLIASGGLVHVSAASSLPVSAPSCALYRPQAAEGAAVVTLSSDDVHAFVTRLYSICLSRDPDAAGLDDWCGRIESGQLSGADVVLGFFHSKEFLSDNLTSSFSSCVGVTNCSTDIWSTDLPYLQSVASPENENSFSDFQIVRTVDIAQMKKILDAIYDADRTTPVTYPADWSTLFQDGTLCSNGTYWKQLRLNIQYQVNPGDLYKSLPQPYAEFSIDTANSVLGFSLFRSTAFTVTYNNSGG